MDWTIVVVIFAAYIGLVRNTQVLHEANRVIDKIHNLNLADINAGNYLYLSARWRAFDEVSYYQMVFEFWKPVRSFYRNHRCLRETNTILLN